MLVVVAKGLGPCDWIVDTQGNSYQFTASSGYYGGAPLCYALNIKGGPETLTVSSAAQYRPTQMIIAEYPPTLWLENASYGTYVNQNGDEPPGQSNYIGWTVPIETDTPNELIIGWGVDGTGGGVPAPVPGFTLVDSMTGWLMLEDGITGIPGYYMAQVRWCCGGGGHWVAGEAIFRTGSLYTVRNPSFEYPAGPWAPSPYGPWNNGPIPEWTQVSGNTGLRQPQNWPIVIPDGITVASFNGGSISQRIGPVSARTYTMTADFMPIDGGSPWEMDFIEGEVTLCSAGGNLPNINVGSFFPETLSCSLPAGDLTIMIQNAAGGFYVDNVQLNQR